MKTMGDLLVLFIGLVIISVIIAVIIGLAGVVSVHIFDFLENKIEDFIYKIKEKENV